MNVGDDTESHSVVDQFLTEQINFSPNSSTNNGMNRLSELPIKCSRHETKIVSNT